MPILKEWLQDLPQQFKNKRKITILFSSFAKQLQELEQVFEDVNKNTNPDTAIGKILDDVGTIVSLSRKEAGELAEIGVTEPIISDERYRQVLKYRILRNTSECTYNDIMEGLEYLYHYNFRYREEEEYPATIFLDLPNKTLDASDLAFYRGLCIKPSGVKILVTKRFYDKVNIPIRYEFNKIKIQEMFYPRSNIPFLRYDNTAQYNGTVRYDKYKSSERIDLYPIRLHIASESSTRMFLFPKIRMQQIFSLPIHTETTVGYVQENKLHTTLQQALQIKLQTPILPRYEISLKIGKHPNRYDGKTKYNGKSRYYVAKIENL